MDPVVRCHSVFKSPCIELNMTIPENTVDVESGKLSVKIDRPAETYSIPYWTPQILKSDKDSRGLTPHLGLTEDLGGDFR